jgi:hypothetical protein
MLVAEINSRLRFVCRFELDVVASSVYGTKFHVETLTSY